MSQAQTSDKYCIIGAGAAGLATVKNFLDYGIPFDCLERTPDIGGLWNMATDAGIVYETTHLVSSVKYTGYDAMPMDHEKLPQYPSHRQVMDYFREFADRFGLIPHISFGRTVKAVRPDGAGWLVEVEGESAPRHYQGVVLANGHHYTPRTPDVPGTFTGEILHSRDYRSPKQLRDKRIVVVGTGNSGCDITIDGVHNADKVFLSMRRGAWFVPKFMLGFPTSGGVAFLEAIPMPRWLRGKLFQIFHLALVGPPTRFGLPQPEYALDQSHPTMNDEVPRLVQHGRITVKPGIARFDGHDVVFTDGSRETVDLVVFATGFEATFPFMDKSYVLRDDGRARLFLNVFHPAYDNLFAIGLVQANGGILRLCDHQSRLVAAFIHALTTDPEKASWFREQKKAGGPCDIGPRYVGSERHRFEVNFYDYHKALKRLIARFGPAPSLGGVVATPRAAVLGDASGHAVAAE